jgi:hypothetical protein
MLLWQRQSTRTRKTPHKSFCDRRHHAAHCTRITSPHALLASTDKTSKLSVCSKKKNVPADTVKSPYMLYKAGHRSETARPRPARLSPAEGLLDAARTAQTTCSAAIAASGSGLAARPQRLSQREEGERRVCFPLHASKSRPVSLLAPAFERPTR